MDLHLRRIEEIDRRGPALRSIVVINPDARAIAESLDVERKTRDLAARCMAVPVIIKDNIDTADKMPTTAGSLALEGSIASRDAFLVERLRAAGAVIVAKSNLSEWANFRSTKSTSGWSAVGGQVRNPYVLDHPAPVGQARERATRSPRTSRRRVWAPKPTAPSSALPA